VTQARPKRHIDEHTELERSVGGVLLPSRLIKGGKCKVRYLAELLGTRAWTERESYFCCRWNSRKKWMFREPEDKLGRIKAVLQSAVSRACRQNVPTNLHLLEKINY